MAYDTIQYNCIFDKLNKTVFLYNATAFLYNATSFLYSATAFDTI